MKRQQAFEGNAPWLKGNLHGHTTRSDGLVPPEEVLRYLRKQGHDFAALTDHRIYNYTNFAPETGITLIPGMEYDNMLEWNNGFRCFHTVCIGPEKKDGNGYEQDETFPSGTAKNQEEYQAYLDRIHAKNNMTFLCHPQWSSTPARYFENQKGNFAMEIWNSSSAIECQTDNDAAYWDEILGQGKRIYGVAVDDSHVLERYGKGWVMVRAENNVSSILKGLREGRFYSSCGPVIKDFYVRDDGIAVIECSPASFIRLHSDKHPVLIQESSDGTMTHAEYNIVGHWAGRYDYIRASVIDKDGKKAWTNPIWLND